MKQTDTKITKRKAFVSGFLQGLASPVFAYSVVAPGTVVVPEFTEVNNPAAKSDGVRGDWRRVGQGLQSAIGSLHANG